MCSHCLTLVILHEEHPYPKLGNQLFKKANDYETVVYDLGEANDPNMAMKMLSEPDVINMRKEAGVDLESQEVLSTISKHKIW